MTRECNAPKTTPELTARKTASPVLAGYKKNDSASHF